MGPTEKAKILGDLLTCTITFAAAARQMNVSLRTVRNYYRRFLAHGIEGLKDRRTGNRRKITPAQSDAIVALKTERPQRSCRFIKKRLKLDVSDEAIRLILAKHRIDSALWLACGEALEVNFAAAAQQAQALAQTCLCAG